MSNSKENRVANVLAHIEAHKAKGETGAVAKHMASPAHKAIVEAATATEKAAAKTAATGAISPAPEPEKVSKGNA